MLGRVRRSSISSLEQLELERQPPKLMKSDSLSIYETTLLKLKEGSRRRDISSCLEDSKGEEASAIDVDSSSSFDSQRQQPKTGNLSLPYLFLRYRSSRQPVSSADEDSCSSATTSPWPSIVQSSS
ncbi:PREDICTED: uncharacterized protein LOC109190506 [Ipomoea nil]|uniref:uncharacterized protein LOC109190506 n=1 Tax=Ipomoea nil TaxID=35883 RepID=UPI0009013AAB|nr:PREDICTED: uncharacterized protein LOC109190506 [Ipomoea nil]XP_019196543.1 PREDICTED: uncharacterized protein LOC109190506 [Ipomoea nil]